VPFVAVPKRPGYPEDTGSSRRLAAGRE
jgi:hypothetical protein